MAGLLSCILGAEGRPLTGPPAQHQEGAAFWPHGVYFLVFLIP